MRARFPHIDYFPTIPFQLHETLTFLQLPLSQVSPSPPLTSTFSDLIFLRSDSIPELSLPIENLPIQTALSKFFSNVIPQKIVTSVEEFEDDVPSSCHKSFNSRSHETHLSEDIGAINEEKEVESYRASQSEVVEVEVLNKSNAGTVDVNVPRRYEVIEFETPELDDFVEASSFVENKGIRILSEVPEIEESLDMLNPGPATYYPYEVHKSVLTVEDIALEHPIGQKDNPPEDFQDQIHFKKVNFQILEVDEIVLEHIADFSVKEKFLSIIENAELQHLQTDGPEFNKKELLGSKDYDVSGFISDHSLSPHSCGYEVGSLDNFPEINLISLVEISQIRMSSGIQRTSDCDCFVSDKPFVYQEFQILDEDSSQIFEELFNRQTVYDTETCDWMFNEDMNFKNFNKLIVSHELALVDDTFKSMPVPVLSDHGKLRSIYTVIKRKLAQLKPQPLSALDGIYLDWHILEEVNYDPNTSINYKRELHDMGSYNIDFGWDSFGDTNVVYDFIFSDDGTYAFNKEENGESKELLSNVSIPVGTEPRKFSGDNFPQPKNEECLARKNAERASLLFKSMSHSNDLDFLRKTQKVTTGKNSEPTVKTFDKDATSPKVAVCNSVADVSQGGESINFSHRDENVNNQKFFHHPSNQEKLFDYPSNQEKCNVRFEEAADIVEACSMPSLAPSMSFPEESNHRSPQESRSSLPKTVILVNTQNLDKEMIVSRRSTYQKILAIEKHGAQVVERDSDLPVDVVINSAICLVWYDCRNIGKKTTAVDEASSSLPLCIENIATNVLTSLSFTFSGCILVFEGENSFLSTVMESSDGLYAAAASLGIDVQLFCSYSSELTDEIIMSCIGYATGGVYPRMTESETLAESFLTKFPSVNPLTAHAILSSGGMLIEFLEWSNERRIHALQKFNVPVESINLLGALLKYGEREDSRSIMTDYSSSVSSGMDSEKSSKRKRWSYDDSLDNIDIRIDELHNDSEKQFSKETINTSSGKKPFEPFMSKDHDTFRQLKNTIPYESNLFHQEQGFDEAMMMNHFVVPEPYDFQMPKESQKFKETRLSGQLQGTNVDLLKNFDLHDISSSDILFADQKGEVIDLTASPAPGKEFSSVANSSSFFMPEMEKDGMRKSRTARRLSFDKDNQPKFPTSAEMCSGSNIWNFVKDQKKNLHVGASNSSDIDLENNATPLDKRSKLLKDRLKHRSAEKSQGLQCQGRNSSLHGDTPLSHALHLASPQQKSPWTMEFLNKIKEKSRFRHQSLPCETAPCFGCSGDVSKVTKRRSPSILEFFKYQGGNTMRKIPEQKKHKRSTQSSSSKDEKPSASILPTWTPLDKRARQTLSFANDGKGQTKLVWNDEIHNPRKKFLHQI
ncbi:protein SHORTAGE IN CHIASMATA 1 isoform X1 [Cannabis sativa]|uniref:protein SHORTAGE IN CHIASMATA 1 isoform X1 n=1 Tax=Cannabis sativa TaxID=3483 RepID=UPI0029C9EE94|nr:protein SHORTAGE IN CHIASMATA 1 isoform X1 [Cannabis sativa]